MILPKLRGRAKTFKEKVNELMSLCINDEKLLEKFIIFLDSTKLKIVWKKITTFFKRRVSIIL